jgi:hypothetical protein
MEVPMLDKEMGVIVPLGKYSAFNALTVNTLGSTFKAYYQLYALNQSRTNVIRYTYPN